MTEKTGKKKEEAPSRSLLDLHPHTRRAIWGVICVGVALVMALAFVGKGGRVGQWMVAAGGNLFGWGAYVAPVIFLLSGVVLLSRQKGRHVQLRVLFSAVVIFVSVLTLLTLIAPDAGHGGMLGVLLTRPTAYFFGYWAGGVLWAVLLIVALLTLFNASPFHRQYPVPAPAEAVPAAEGVPAEAAPGQTLSEKVGRVLRPRFLFTPVGAKPAEKPAENADDSPKAAMAARTAAARLSGAYTPPPLKLLEAGNPQPTPGDVETHTTMIRRTLENFGISVEMAEVNVGPTVTQYTLKPAEGVKLSRIVALQNDLALALAAHPLRIEAPVPGRSLVGIEIPNKTIATVRLRSLLEEEDTSRGSEPLTFALGRDVTATPIYASLAAMPHMLIAGATGSGKSIGIHSFLMNLLYRYGPDDLQLVLVDPKRVELTMYNDIPQLLTPVIVEPKKTVAALRWALTEMDRRYQLFAQYGTRDIASFRQRREKMPYVVIVIDELADIMAAFGREVEAAIVRLAQMARAVGVHLVLSTQRPSVDVITGLIKANIASRIAFQVASQIDSRTILDMSGAEKLLGKGDMLFLRGDGSKPKRVQGAYVSEAEVKRVTDWLKMKAGPVTQLAAAPLDDDGMMGTGQSDDVVPFSDGMDFSIAGTMPGGRGLTAGGTRPGGARPATAPLAVSKPGSIFPDDAGDSVDEPMYEEAKRAVIEAKRASASLLQRRLRVGYARAARLIDLLEERGVIGPGDGARAREILVADQGGQGASNSDLTGQGQGYL